jgi:hypothetical protein
MKYAGGLVKHLGLAMYRGAVPSLAELIANSWDADAAEVRIIIPFDTGGLKNREIVVADTGRGMTWQEVQDAYLLVGRDRRRAQGDKTEGGRAVMGRKGLGKLAGFGIAQLVEVRTVRDGWLTHFSMDFNDMTKEGKAGIVESYEPRIITDESTAEPNGTVITLKELQLSRAIPKEEFLESMARRFSILQKGFAVHVNGELLKPYDTPLQFRFEGKQEGWDDVPGIGSVKWWIGFAEKPIQSEALRGIAVLVRDKMAQAPFFFNLSGGTHGQAGMQYLTGEVYADQLDQEKDYIGTDRQGILWAEPAPDALLQWGQTKIRESLGKWVDLRNKKNEEQLVATVTSLGNSVDARISRLRPSEQKEARSLVSKLASIESVTDDPARARDLLDMVLRAFEDSSFFALLRALSATNKAAREEVLKLVTELDVFEVVKMAEVVRARVGVIQKFREMIESDVPEKPDMQDFLFDHPWLIDPEWIVKEHERRLEQLLVKQFKISPAADPDSDKRVDFFCISTRGRYLVVEVKRPAKSIGRDEVTQIIEYVQYLREQAPTSGQGRSPNSYEGVLVGHHLTQAGLRWRETAAKAGVTVRSWSELLDVAERIHRDFLNVMKKKVPDDLRVQEGLAFLGSEEG